MKNLYSEKDITVSFRNNEIAISGPLTQDTVSAALLQSESLLPHEQAITLNLAGVNACDSSSLAFVTALLRASKIKKSSLSLTHLPKEMLDLATVSGLNSFLPLKDK